MTADARHQRRPRRSREEVSQALVDATTELLAQRPSGHVTVRDIAARANVNPTLIHRYFGTKRSLMHAAIQVAQQHIVKSIEDMPDVIAGAASVFQSGIQEKTLIAAFARAALDGILADVPPTNPAMAALVDRFSVELERRGAAGGHDPRILVACLTSTAMGYALFGEFIRRGTGLDQESEEWIEASIVEALQDLARAALGD